MAGPLADADQINNARKAIALISLWWNLRKKPHKTEYEEKLLVIFNKFIYSFAIFISAILITTLVAIIFNDRHINTKPEDHEFTHSRFAYVDNGQLRYTKKRFNYVDPAEINFDISELEDEAKVKLYFDDQWQAVGAMVYRDTLTQRIIVSFIIVASELIAMIIYFLHARKTWAEPLTHYLKEHGASIKRMTPSR